ncbi:unnamed protein product [Sphagnum balticum]
MHRDWAASEGELSKRRASLVNETVLATIARELELNEYLILGRGEVNSNGHDKNSILASGFESVLGAVYIDGGYTAARIIVERLFSPRIAALETSSPFVKDYKTRLQEFLQSYVTLVGLPNVGKSSLVNALVRESVSIVTSKPQTTRKRTLGILTESEKYQMIFVDTPGVIESNEGLNPYLKSELKSALKNVDVVVAALGPWEFKSDVKPWILKLTESLQPQPIFILTQVDGKNAEDSEQILLRAKKWKEWIGDDVLLLPTSSRNRLNLDVLKDLILERLPSGPQYYDTDIYTPQSLREVSSEIIRKHCFEALHQELPYGLAVLIQTFEEGGPVVKISADILVARESHKPMVIGAKGAVLKQIGTRARYELEKITKPKSVFKSSRDRKAVA